LPPATPVSSSTFDPSRSARYSSFGVKVEPVSQ
jgi:hypothetical protein